MTILRVGSTPRYASNFDKAFGAKKKSASKAKKKTTKKKATKKKTSRKK